MQTFYHATNLLERAYAGASSAASSVVVFAALVGVGWWGHHTHWTLPWMNEKPAANNAPAAGPSPKSAEPYTVASIGRQESRKSTDELPSIEFSTASAAVDCGIATSIVEQRSMDETVTANGVVSYDQTHLAQLSVRVPGVVWRVERHVGDIVEAGDVLMIVDSAEIGAAKAALLEAAAVYNLKAQTRKRLQDVQVAISARSLHEAEAAEEVARAQRFNALQRLVNLGFSLRLDEIANESADEIAERLHWLGLSNTVQKSNPSANLIPLVAPFKGVLTHCDVVRGEVVDSSKPQVTIADVQYMWINLDVRHEDCARIGHGAQVVFQGEGNLPSVIGTLTWIGTEINPRTRTVQARAEVKNPALGKANDPAQRRLLQANAFGTAHIVVAANPTTVAVPSDSLHWQWELGRNIVFVPSSDGRRFEPRIVRKGLVRDDYAQVIDGLAVGEHVVTSGGRILASELAETLQQRLGDNSHAGRAYGIMPVIE